MNKPRAVLVNADLHKGFGDWMIALPAMKLLRDTWGAYLHLTAISPEHLLPLVEMTGIFDEMHPYRLDWCEYYAPILDHAWAVIALMDSDMWVYEDVLARTAAYQIQNQVYRNLFWKEKQHHGLMVARNLAPLLGYEPKAPLQHPLTRWQRPRGRYVAIHTGRGPTWHQGDKDWPYYYNLSRHLVGADWDVIQVVGPDDPVLAGVPVWRGSTRQLADMLLGCQLFVGNDSGPGHLAGALGVPTHIIFGTMEPEMWHPIGPRVTWSWAESRRISEVTVSEVWAAIQGKLSAYVEAA